MKVSKNKKTSDSIEIIGARVHNLKNVSIEIPKNQLIIISGVSGSGKSSLAFDTLFAEGQRRYIESLSSYARQFLGKIQKPEVDQIKGICPAIAIEQKKITNNPRSTIGTTTEIYDYIKLLFSRIGKTFSPISHQEVVRHKVSDVVDFIKNQKEKDIITILSRNNSLDDKLDSLIMRGFSRIMIKNDIHKITNCIKRKTPLNTKEYYIVIDRINNNSNIQERIADSVQTAFFEGNGECYIKTSSSIKKFSNKFKMDGVQFEETSINLFSFNNPYGACSKCEGFGSILGIEKKKVIPNENLSVYQGAVNCWSGEKLKKWKERFIIRSAKYNFPIHKPYKELSNNEIDILWNGKNKCKGIYQFFKRLEKEKYKIQNRVLIARYRGKTQCEICKGSRLREDALYVKVFNKNIAEITNMNIKEALIFFTKIKLNKVDSIVAKRIIKEITERLNCLNEIGLGYLTLDRRSNTLSGGESQRINIATSIGSSLVGAMYILDEPSIGLHSRDTKRLIKILKELRDIGNTVIVVEHDDDIMEKADQIIDIGPYAGIHGGEIIFQGNLKKMSKKTNSLTAKYLNNKLEIPIPKSRRKLKEYINLQGVTKHNLNNINIAFPLNGLVLISGVSGSGKSTLIRDVLEPALSNLLSNILKKTSAHKFISISDNSLKNVELVDQNPIGRSSRSNPITYIKVYDEIRKLFANQELSKKRKYKSGMFSFNIDGGRCDNCKGEGEIKIEMQFMADVHIKCEICKGKRFKDEILDVKFKGKNVADILEFSVIEAINFFQIQSQCNISNKLKPLQEVGLNYIKLGQSSNTLSGGEAQRIKLASFLSKGITNEKTLFIFDEPTTGLHFHDIKKLLNSFYALIEQGHSIICIEHNMHVIKCADWIIDLGPEGGEKGGKIMFSGTPEDIILCKKSVTGKYLKNKL